MTYLLVSLNSPDHFWPLAQKWPDIWFGWVGGGGGGCWGGGLGWGVGGVGGVVFWGHAREGAEIKELSAIENLVIGRGGVAELLTLYE